MRTCDFKIFEVTLHKSGYKFSKLRSLDEISCRIAEYLEEHVAVGLPANKKLKIAMLLMYVCIPRNAEH